MVALNFNAAQVKPNAALEAIPSGNYPVIITRTEEKPTKSGSGSYIEIEMTVQGGEFAGRKVFDRLNIRNPNQTAVDIAYATLSAICHVTGVIQMQDTQQLHGRPFQAVVIKKERDDQPGSGNMTNEVKGYKDIQGNDPGFAGTTTAPAQQAPAPAPQQQAYAPQPGAPAPAPAWAPQAAAPAQPAPAASAPQQAQPAAQVPAGPAAGGAAPPWAQPAQ